MLTVTLFEGKNIAKPVRIQSNSALTSSVAFDAMKKARRENILPFEEFKRRSIYKPEYLEKMYPDESTYLELETTFSTFAVVTPDGEWHEQGEMGWFGCSSDTPEDMHAWNRAYWERFIVPALEKGWIMTIVDCHI